MSTYRFRVNKAPKSDYVLACKSHSISNSKKLVYNEVFGLRIQGTTFSDKFAISPGSDCVLMTTDTDIEIIRTCLLLFAVIGIFGNFNIIYATLKNKTLQHKCGKGITWEVNL